MFLLSYSNIQLRKFLLWWCHQWYWAHSRRSFSRKLKLNLFFRRVFCIILSGINSSSKAALFEPQYEKYRWSNKWKNVIFHLKTANTPLFQSSTVKLYIIPQPLSACEAESAQTRDVSGILAAANKHNVEWDYVELVNEQTSVGLIENSSHFVALFISKW